MPAAWSDNCATLPAWPWSTLACRPCRLDPTKVSHCSDDLLWLVWALCEYVDATGDTALCDIETRYLASPVLSESERDRYETPESTQK